VKNVDNELEMCLLGCMVMEPAIIPNVINEVSETDFHAQINREIFRAIVGLNQSKRQLDLVAIVNEVKQDPAYIATITDKVATSANWAYYAGHVKNLSRTRSFVELVETCKGATPETVEHDLSAFISQAIKISDNQGGLDIKSCRDMMLSVITQIESAHLHRGKISGLDCGFDSLNDMLDGLQSEYIIIGARASIGKTALAVNMAHKMAKAGVPVGYFSLEMSGESLLMRIISDASTVQARTLRSGFMTDKDVMKVCNRGMDIAEYPLYVMDRTRGELDKIIAKSRYMARVMGIKCIFIDHASLIRHSNRNLKRFEQFSEISNEIQALQRELNVPIVLLAQLGRESEGKKPTLADLRESGGFEQDADTVILMHRERKKEIGDTRPFIETDIDIAKNRNGACGEIKMAFFPEYIRFADMVSNERGNK